MFKLLLSFLFMLPVATWASPELAERREFCQFAAGNTLAAAEARQKLNMPPAEFQERAMVYFMGLIENGVPEMLVMEIMDMLLEGWNSPFDPETAAAKAFEGCMQRKNI